MSFYFNEWAVDYLCIINSSELQTQIVRGSWSELFALGLSQCSESMSLTTILAAIINHLKVNAKGINNSAVFLIQSLIILLPFVKNHAKFQAVCIMRLDIAKKTWYFRCYNIQSPLLIIHIYYLPLLLISRVLINFVTIMPSMSQLVFCMVFITVMITIKINTI
jgi:hypothetical protein